ncbi:MAG: SpoIIE family protein phosphatase, partial [Bacteroidota bacterium]
RRFGESSSRNVLALQPGRDGSLWYITDDGLFRRRLNAAGWVMIEPFLKQRPYLDYTLISLYQDPWDNLWVGTFGNGLIWLNPESGETKLYRDELGNGNILGLTGKEDQIWLATLGGATQISISEDGLKAARNYMASDGLNTNYIYQVFIDSKDRVWFGTDGNGIGLMEEGKFTSFKVRDTDSEVIYSFAEDGNGNIWINSLGQGLYRYDGRLFDNLGLEEGLRDVNIGAIQSDVNGNIVAIHEQGIDVYSLESNRFHPLGEEIGLRDMIPNLNAVAKDDFDNLWFGTEHGVIRYSDVLGNRISRPRPFIHQIKLFQDPIDLMKSGSSLGYNENNLTIEYIGFWYQSPENLNFRYRLDNYELEWIQSRNRSVTYSSLPPGEYIFRLQVSETENFDNAFATSYKLTIRPPFWERTWFYVVTVLGIIIIVLGFVKFRERSLLTAKRNLEMKVEERTREIAAQNVQIQAKNEEITEKNRNITESITYAERIQTAILPLGEKIDSCFPEHFILYKPRDIVSGDFYWFYEDGDLLYLAAIDCTGHGVPGALMSMIGYSLLNGILSNQPGLTPAYVLDQLDQGVINSFKKDEVPESARARPNDGMDMAMVRYNRASRELIYSGAKRPLYHILNGELTEIKGDKNAIGGSRNDEDGIAFQDHVVPVEEGSMVYIFSDGYPDQFGGPQNKKFMLRQFKNMLLEHHQLPVVAQRRIYDERLTAWKKEQSQTDDILLIGLRF